MHMGDLVDLRIDPLAHAVEALAEARRGVGAELAEAWGQLGQAVERGARPRMLVMVEQHVACRSHYRDEAAIKAALGDRLGGALLAGDGHLVALVAGEA